MSILGTRVVRTEDPRLLTSGGTYVDDLRVPELAGAARVTFVRSPIAHALITALDPSAARDAPGVIAVFTAQDMDDLPPLPDDGAAQNPSEGAPLPLGGRWSEPLLATDRVRFVGEPVAIVLTDDSYRGEDAAELVSVDYEPLPAVVGFTGALDTETLLFPGTDSNVAVSAGSPADGSAFDGCDVVIEHTIENQRLAPVPLEGRAAAAAWADGRLTVWLSTQNAQISRFILAGALGLDPAAIRVITPDVGGGFGAKVGMDRDGITVAWA
ncbi:MAG: xanthine dehydrogenase family protein molybdopterin-binding subunit, partial [Streptosporangiaceae bacterium]